MDIHVAQLLYDFWDNALTTLLNNGVANVVLGVGALVGTFWLVNFTLRSINWLYSGLNQAAQEIVFEILKVAFIGGCAFNISWYVSTIVPFVSGFPTWVGGVLSGQAGTQVNQIDAMIVSFFTNLITFASSIKFSIMNIEFGSLYLSIQALVFYILGGLPFILVAAGTTIVLKAASTVIVALGPLFIIFALFNVTRQWFWGWVSLLAGFMLAQTLFSVVLALELTCINSNIIKGGQIDNSIAGNVTMLVVFATFTVLAAELPNYAASIMGGTPVGATGIGGILKRGTGVNAAMNATRGASRLLGKIPGRNNIK